MNRPFKVPKVPQEKKIAVPTKPFQQSESYAHREPVKLPTPTAEYAAKMAERKAARAKKPADPNRPQKLTQPTRPTGLPPPPKYDPTKINFGEEDPWLQGILNDTWTKLPEDWKRDIGRYPYSALKAWLFFYNQGPGGVLFDDQFLPGHLAAQKIQEQVEAQFSRQQNYNQNAMSNYQNQLQNYKQQQEVAAQQPLPFRAQRRYM